MTKHEIIQHWRDETFAVFEKKENEVWKQITDWVIRPEAEKLLRKIKK